MTTFYWPTYWPPIWPQCSSHVNTNDQLTMICERPHGHYHLCLAVIFERFSHLWTISSSIASRIWGFCIYQCHYIRKKIHYSYFIGPCFLNSHWTSSMSFLFQNWMILGWMKYGSNRTMLRWNINVPRTKFCVLPCVFRSRFLSVIKMQKIALKCSSIAKINIFQKTYPEDFLYKIQPKIMGSWLMRIFCITYFFGKFFHQY